MKDTLFVNLFGGPGLGKSTTAAGVFSMLKLHGVDAELVTEFPKDLVWEERDVTITNQVYVFGKQYHRHWRLNGKVDVVVTDSPVLLSAAYEPDEDHRAYILRKFLEFDNANFMLKRAKAYNPNGRYQTRDEAVEKDLEVERILTGFGQPFFMVKGDYGAVNRISEQILARMGLEITYKITRM